MEIDLTTIVVQIVVAIIGGFFLLITPPLRKWLETRLSTSQLSFLDSLAIIGVRAAEQVFEAGDGAGKLDYATRVVQEELDRRKIKVDAATVRAAIESALVAEFNYGKLVEPATPPANTDVVMTPGGTEA